MLMFLKIFVELKLYLLYALPHPGKYYIFKKIFCILQAFKSRPQKLNIYGWNNFIYKEHIRATNEEYCF